MNFEEPAEDDNRVKLSIDGQPDAGAALSGRLRATSRNRFRASDATDMTGRDAIVLYRRQCCDRDSTALLFQAAGIDVLVYPRQSISTMRIR